jgi:hypothetical protein
MRNFPISLRWMLALIVVAAIAVALFLRNSSRDDAGAAATETAAESVAESPASGAGTEADEAQPNASVSKAERRPVPRARPTREPREPSPGSETVWKGAITFLDSQPTGASPAGSDVDWLTLGFVCFGELHPVNVVIRDARFECAVPFVDEDIEEVRVLRAVALGGRWLPEAGFEKLSPEFAAEGRIQLRRAPVTYLNVVDDASGATISPVKLAAQQMSEWLYRRGYWEGTLTSQPISMDDVRVSADSNGRVEVLVRSEGWAEGTAEIDVDAGGTRELRLKRAGTAEFRWVVPEAVRSTMGASANWPAMSVQLQPEELGAKSPERAGSISASGSRWGSAHAVDSTLGVADVVKARVTGIVPGCYKAVLRLSAFAGKDGLELALAQFVVRADETSEVELATVHTLDVGAYASRIQIEIPGEYGAVKELTLLMRRVEPGRDPEWTSWTPVVARETSPSIWQSALPRVDPGLCQFGISIDPSVRVEVEVRTGTVEPIRVVVPTPFRYQIRLRTRSSEAPPKPRSMSWCPGSSEGSSSGERVSESKGVYEIITGSPEIVVSLGDVRLDAARPRRVGGSRRRGRACPRRSARSVRSIGPARERSTLRRTHDLRCPSRPGPRRPPTRARHPPRATLARRRARTARVVPRTRRARTRA